MKNSLFAFLVMGAVAVSSVASETRIVNGHALYVIPGERELFHWKDPATDHEWIGLPGKDLISFVRSSGKGSKLVWTYFIASKGKYLPDGTSRSQQLEFEVDCGKMSMTNILLRKSSDYFEPTKWKIVLPEKDTVSLKKGTLLGTVAEISCSKED